MKHAISNIALPPFHHERELNQLGELGFSGLEVAPSRVWENSARVKPAEVAQYRKRVEAAGLKVLGIHSLFFDQPDLGLFKGREVRERTLDFLTHLSQLCADLGGRTLVYGSPRARRRNGLPLEEADREAESFFEELCGRINGHGTCFVIEALGPTESDYIHSVRHALRITQKVRHPALQSHLDAKAVTEADEATSQVFREVAPTLAHFHVNDPGLGVPGETGKVDHQLLGRLLHEIDYQGYVSIEMRMVNPEEPMKPIRQGLALLKRCYQ